MTMTMTMTTTTEPHSRARRPRPASSRRSPRGLATSSPGPPPVERHHRDAFARAHGDRAGGPVVLPEPSLVLGPVLFVEENSDLRTLDAFLAEAGVSDLQ